MDDFLLGLKREELLSILKNELFRRFRACVNEDVFERAELRFSGLSYSEVIELLADKVELRSIVYDNKPPPWPKWDWDIKEETIVHKFPFIEINTQAIKINASVEEAAQTLMKDKRAELVSALLGEGALND